MGAVPKYYGAGPIVEISCNGQEEVFVRTGRGNWGLDRVINWAAKNQYSVMGYIDNTQQYDLQMRGALVFCQTARGAGRMPIVLSPNWDMLYELDLRSWVPEARVVFLGGKLTPFMALARAADVRATALAQYAFELDDSQMDQMREETTKSGIAWCLNVRQPDNHCLDSTAQFRRALSYKPNAIFCAEPIAIERRVPL